MAAKKKPKNTPRTGGKTDYKIAVTVHELADLLGKSVRTVNRYAERGLIKKTARGRFDLVSSLLLLIANNNPRRDLMDAQAYDTRERGMLNETKRKKLQGELIYSDDVTAGTAQLVVGLVKIHDEMERNIRRRLPTVPEEVMQEVMKASDWARNAGAKLCETGTFEPTDYE